jgi:hypothetical protein
MGVDFGLETAIWDSCFDTPFLSPFWSIVTKSMTLGGAINIVLPSPVLKLPYPKNDKTDISSKLPKSTSHPKIDNQAKPPKFIIIKKQPIPP